MRTLGLRRAAAFWSSVGILLIVSARAVTADDVPRAPQPAAKTAAQLVRAALESEAAGKLDDRAVYLRDALTTDANYAPAHWHAGQVLVDGRWISVIETSEAGNPQAGRLEKYRKLRQEMTPTIEDHIRLARYCREAGLTAQERMHLALVLQLDRSNKEALTKMKALRRPPDAKAAVQRAKVHEDARRQQVDRYAKWKDQISRLRDDLEGGDAERRQSARTQLLAIRDVLAIPALESVLSASSQVAGRLVVAVLSEMPEQEATVSLAKHAVLSEWPDVREAATNALKSRDMYAYVPGMLAAMAMPVEYGFEVFGRYGSAVGHRLSLYEEGPMYDSKYDSMATYTPPNPFVSVPPGVTVLPAGVILPADDSRPRANLVAEIYRAPLKEKAAAASAVASQIERRNERARVLNERIAYVLSSVTGKERPPVPTQWWKWWTDHNEIYMYEEKPVHETTQYQTRPYLSFRLTPIRYSSCFIKGTPVWTRSGPIPVEKLLVGELVLSQDAITGELCYQPVLATTVRPPARTLALKVGSEEILATRGHPFWVSGTGWRMAKELKQGNLLHTPGGACAIEGIEERAEYPTYNLVVAVFNSYFVGRGQVLVHDNTIRQATPTIVPGLTR